MQLHGLRCEDSTSRACLFPAEIRVRPLFPTTRPPGSLSLTCASAASVIEPLPGSALPPD